MSNECKCDCARRLDELTVSANVESLSMIAVTANLRDIYNLLDAMNSRFDALESDVRRLRERLYNVECKTL